MNRTKDCDKRAGGVKVRNIRIDTDKLTECMEAAGKSRVELSTDIGKSKNYIQKVMERGVVGGENIERLICMILDKPPGYFVIKEEIPPVAQEEGGTSEMKILQNIYKEILELRSEIASVQKKQEAADDTAESINACIEKIFSKVNANTTQLEKIKESTKLMAMTEPERAACYLKELLSDGKMLGDDVLKKCDGKGFKREAVFKARDELQIKQVTTGFGKCQKKWWVL